MSIICGYAVMNKQVQYQYEQKRFSILHIGNFIAPLKQCYLSWKRRVLFARISANQDNITQFSTWCFVFGTHVLWAITFTTPTAQYEPILYSEGMTYLITL